MTSIKLYLPDSEATLRLGSILARGYLSATRLPPLLLEGGLGAGKTTLVRGLVESLPGAEQAEVGSPSFNIMNLYPTRPETAHFDLYRLEGAIPDDEFFDSLDLDQRLTIVEWAQYLSEPDRPEDALCLVWSDSEQGRNLIVRAVGECSTLFLESLKDRLREFSSNQAA